MSICATGVSRRKAGTPRYIILTQGIIADLIGPVAPWLLPFIANGRDIALDMDVVCAADPPGFDTWTSALLIALGLSSNATVNVAVAVAQVVQWATNIGWYQWCECADATATVLPAPPAAPADVPTFTPPMTSGGTGYLAEVLADSPTEFWRLADPSVGRAASVGSNRTDLTPTEPHMAIAGFTGPSSDGGSWLLQAAPLRVRGLTFTIPGTVEFWYWQGHSSGGFQPVLNVPVAGGLFQVRINQSAANDAGGTGFTTSSWDAPAPQAWHHVVAAIEAAQYKLYVDGALVDTKASTATTGTGTLDLGPSNDQQAAIWWSEAAVYATALSATRVAAHYNAADQLALRPAVKLTSAPPRVADGLTNEVLQIVTLIQRQGVPFGYIAGTAHAGLAGSGQFAIADLIGIAVDLTTTPSQLGIAVGDPELIFDAGVVNLGTGDGWQQSVRIDHDPTLIFPISGAETVLGYTLHAGVVATITELTREP